MARMYRVLAFWTLVIGLMFAWGELWGPAVLFFAQTAAFLTVSYMGLSERAYLLIFWGYMILAFTGILYWSFFKMEPGQSEQALSALRAALERGV